MSTTSEQDDVTEVAPQVMDGINHPTTDTTNNSNYEHPQPTQRTITTTIRIENLGRPR